MEGRRPHRRTCTVLHHLSKHFLFMIAPTMTMMKKNQEKSTRRMTKPMTTHTKRNTSWNYPNQRMVTATVRHIQKLHRHWTKATIPIPIQATTMDQHKYRKIPNYHPKLHSWNPSYEPNKPKERRNNHNHLSQPTTPPPEYPDPPAPEPEPEHPKMAMVEPDRIHT